MKTTLISLATLVMIGSMGCSTVPEEQPVEEIASDPLVDSRGRALPSGAVEVGDDVYMVPAGPSGAQTCQSYHLYSPIKRVDQSMYYRTADGRFVRSQAEADCPSEIRDDN